VFDDDTKQPKSNRKTTENEVKEVRHEVKLKDQKCQIFYDKLTFIYLEMPNFTKTEDELETLYDKWLFVLKNLPKLDKRPPKLQEKVFEHLFKAAEIAKFSPEEREQYENSRKYYWDMKNVVDTAFDEGKLEEKTETIIRGLKSGVPVETIAMISGVTIDYVLKIKNENGL
jgi:predicted transposase/invertase (TIGR01784 family)